MDMRPVAKSKYRTSPEGLPMCDSAPAFESITVVPQVMWS